MGELVNRQRSRRSRRVATVIVALNVFLLVQTFGG